MKDVSESLYLTLFGHILSESKLINNCFNNENFIECMQLIRWLAIRFKLCFKHFYFQLIDQHYHSYHLLLTIMKSVMAMNLFQKTLLNILLILQFSMATI